MKNETLHGGLRVSADDGELTIKIGIHNLQWAFEQSEGNNHFDEKSGDFKRAMKVTHPQKFADEIVCELTDEEEDGSSAVTRMFDRAFESAVGNGCEGVEEV